jgi:hypothetical protein
VSREFLFLFVDGENIVALGMQETTDDFVLPHQNLRKTKCL